MKSINTKVALTLLLTTILNNTIIHARAMRIQPTAPTAVRQNNRTAAELTSAIKSEQEKLLAAKTKEEQIAAKAELRELTAQAEDLLKTIEENPKNKEIKQAIKNHIEKLKVLLTKEQNYYAKLTDKAKQEKSVQRQESIKKRITEQEKKLALAEGWSFTTKAALIGAAFTATAGIGVVAAYAFPTVASTILGAKGGALATGAGAKVVSAGSALAATPRWAYTKASEYWNSKPAEENAIATLPTEQPVEGQQTWSSWAKSGATTAAAGAVNSFFGLAPIAMDPQGGWKKNTGIFVLNNAINSQTSKAKGYLWDKAQNWWITPDGKVVANPDGTPYKTTDQPANNANSLKIVEFAGKKYVYDEKTNTILGPAQIGPAAQPSN